MTRRRPSRTSQPKEVHIIPLGWEFDRCILPFSQGVGDEPPLTCHRVHLVSPRGDDKGFPGRVEEELAAANRKVVRHQIDRDDGDEYIEFTEMLKAVSQLCHKETAAGNNVRINISAGSRIAALAAGLAGMAYQHTGRVELYYVRPKTYTSEARGNRTKLFAKHGQTMGMRDILFMDPMPMVKPKRLPMQVLHYLAGRPDEAATFRDAIRYLQSKGLKDKRNKPVFQVDESPGKKRDSWNNAVTKLKRELRAVTGKSWRLIEVDKFGQEGTLRLTKEGYAYALMAHDGFA